MSEQQLCRKCLELLCTDDMGTCSQCGGDTTSGAYAICGACAKKRGVCQVCLDPMERRVNPQREVS